MVILARRLLTPAAILAVVAGLATIAAVTLVRHASAAPALDDPTIVAIFDAANTYDMETGALAVTKGTTAEVRDFGKMLVGDHRHVRTLGRDLAESLHVTPTPPKDFPLAKAHAQAMRTLQQATGPEFDRAFLRHEVDFHSAVIDAVTTTLLPAIQNAEVKELVAKVAPAFVAHRYKAQSMLDKMN
jgi:putative membrane protein